LQTKNSANLFLNLILLGLLFISFLGIFVPIYIGKSSLLILASYLIIPTILAVAFFMVKKNIAVRELVGNYNIKRYNFIFIIFYILSIGLLFMFDLRNILYYVSVSILGLIVFLEILNLEISVKYRNIILAQISLLVLNLIYSVTLKYDFFIGRMDLSFHIGVINSLLKNDFITGIFGIYEPFPCWFIINDFFIKLTNIVIPVQKVVFLLSGIVFCIIMVCIFILCKFITNNLKLSLLVTLLIGIFPDFIFIGMYSIPRSIAILFEILLLIFLLKSYSGKSVAMSIFFTFIILIFHTVTILFIMVIIVSIIVVTKFYGVKLENNLNYKYMVTSGIMILLYWVFNASILYDRVVGALASLANSSFFNLSGDVNRFSVGSSNYNEVFNYIQYAILFFFIVIGNLYILKDNKLNKFTKSLVILGLLFVVISFPGFISVISGLSGNLNLTRFSEQTFLFTNLAGAVGLLYLYKRPSRVIKIVLIFSVFALIFFSSSNDFVASDNPLVKREFYTYYFTNIEINSFRFIGSHNLGSISTDYVAYRFINEQGISGDVSVLEYYSNENTILKSTQNDLILIRISEASKRPLHLYTSPDGIYVSGPSVANRLAYFYFDSTFQMSLSRHNLVFSSNDVMTFS
jgi:hypothetical protein